jgi:hypothetical protein
VHASTSAMTVARSAVLLFCMFVPVLVDHKMFAPPFFADHRNVPQKLTVCH